MCSTELKSAIREAIQEATAKPKEHWKIRKLRRQLERIERSIFDIKRLRGKMDETQQFTLSITQTRGTLNDSSRSVSFIASTPTLDRHGTIVKSEGIQLERYKQNPVVLWAHDGYGSLAGPPSIDNVIGQSTNLRSSRESLRTTVKFLPESVNPRAETALQMVKSGALGAVSIGFKPIESHMEKIQGMDVLVFDKTELLEISLVPVPANPDAIALN